MTRSNRSWMRTTARRLMQIVTQPVCAIWLWLVLLTAAVQTEPQKNVFGRALGIASKDPITGWFRDGYCNTGRADSGDHSIAGVATQEFLDFSAKQGNDLRGIVKPGCTWCFCVGRWLEAFEFARRDPSSPIIPKLKLEATNQNALKRIDLKDLKPFAIDGGKDEL